MESSSLIQLTAMAALGLIGCNTSAETVPGDRVDTESTSSNTGGDDVEPQTGSTSQGSEEESGSGETSAGSSSTGDEEEGEVEPTDVLLIEQVVGDSRGTYISRLGPGLSFEAELLYLEEPDVELRGYVPAGRTVVLRRTHDGHHLWAVRTDQPLPGEPVPLDLQGATNVESVEYLDASETLIYGAGGNVYAVDLAGPAPGTPQFLTSGTFAIVQAPPNREFAIAQRVSLGAQETLQIDPASPEATITSIWEGSASSWQFSEDSRFSYFGSRLDNDEEATFIYDALAQTLPTQLSEPYPLHPFSLGPELSPRPGASRGLILKDNDIAEAELRYIPHDDDGNPAPAVQLAALGTPVSWSPDGQLFAFESGAALNVASFGTGHSPALFVTAVLGLGDTLWAPDSRSVLRWGRTAGNGTPYLARIRFEDGVPLPHEEITNALDGAQNVPGDGHAPLLTYQAADTGTAVYGLDKNDGEAGTEVLLCDSGDDRLVRRVFWTPGGEFFGCWVPDAQSGSTLGPGSFLLGGVDVPGDWVAISTTGVHSFARLWWPPA